MKNPSNPNPCLQKKYDRMNFGEIITTLKPGYDKKYVCIYIQMELNDETLKNELKEYFLIFRRYNYIYI